MSEVLDDSGAGKETVMERRRTYLWRECMMNIACFEKDSECFHFGSQSEGTTIPGLQSDIDCLHFMNIVNIMRVWEDWEAGMISMMMLHDDITPPQQYLLQVIRNNIPELETSLYEDLLVRTDSGQVLLSAERCKDVMKYQVQEKGKVTIHGPSVSFMYNWDMVSAFPVCKPLPEIQYWIDRCTARHWPPLKLLEAARVVPCFLVPAGHPENVYKREEWRLSLNLIKRMLIFSLKISQLKCYIVLKLINTSLFSNIVGDALTSFHSKTIMF
ncbi:hypothetical protein DPMN_158161 [Dreissena polymorpha]|uniref:Uncharacterized protein n=1 Tax=Dreissena polymorpha TaxID=45954 RepID=A0A9D4IQN4_DREPO|nr:hypothetical protein DPMN_158161 [Dreissena polymorpha]